MKECPHCSYRFSVHDESPRLCPRCGATFSVGDPDGQWVSIARLTNLAEVGYFADMLEHRDIATRVRQHNEFSAVDGSWQAIYILQAPAAAAAHGANLIRSELDQSSLDDETTEARWSDHLARGTAVRPLALWLSVLAMLLAGGWMYAVRHTKLAAPNPRHSAPALWDTLIEADRVLVGEDARGQARSRIVTDRRTRTVWVQEDLDGDGRFDRLRCFRDGTMTAEVNR